MIIYVIILVPGIIINIWVWTMAYKAWKEYTKREEASGKRKVIVWSSR